MKKKAAQRKKTHLISASLKIKDGEIAAYQGIVVFSPDAKNSREFQLKTRSRRANPCGFAFVSTYVEKGDEKWLVCVFRHPLAKRDDSIVFHFPFSRKKGSYSVTGRMQISGESVASFTAFLTIK